jgi:hypothetical protein
LKSSICDSETIQALHEPELDFGAEVLFTRIMVSCCDDYGRFDARPAMVRSKCWPLMPERIPLEWVEKWLDKLERRIRPDEPGLISRYDAPDEKGVVRHCGAMNKWSNHQRVRNSKSKLPPPPDNNLLSIDGEPPQPAATGSDVPPDSGLRTPDSGHQTLDTRTGIPAPSKPDAPPKVTIAKADSDKVYESYTTAFLAITNRPYMNRRADFVQLADLLKRLGYAMDPAKAVASVLDALDTASKLDTEARKLSCPDKYDLFPDTLALFCSRVNRYTPASLKTIRDRIAGIAEAISNKQRATGQEPPKRRQEIVEEYR